MIDIQYSGQSIARTDEILTPEALGFLADLHTHFGERRTQLLRARDDRQAELRRGGQLQFLGATHHIRRADWQVAVAPSDLVDRRVEMTGPTDRKMSINALNSGAQVWLADLEDANTPHWRNVVSGQVNLMDAVRRRISYVSPDGRTYHVNDGARLPAIVMRPRGWHLPERHLLIDGAPASGALVDFGLYFFHNAAELLRRGSGPYFYLPKMESHLEARLWNDIFRHAQQQLAIAVGTVRATVLIETIPAAFEMDEILYELREHASGLNAGRWDYLFNIIKKFRDSGSDYVLPDRNAVTMTAPFLQAYTELLIQTCHRRGAFAIGGMAAFIPNRQDAEINELAFTKVRDDKRREATAGFDGSWVAHPDLVPLCAEVFGAVLGTRANQLDRQRDDVQVDAPQLLDIAATPGDITLVGLRSNVDVAIRYLESWLRGIGAAAIHNLMEDAATAEISRAQLWQWLRNKMQLTDGTTIDEPLVRRLVEEQAASTRTHIGELAWAKSRFEDARTLFAALVLADDFIDFLTLPAYDLID